MELLHQLKDLTNPQAIFAMGGLALLFVVIFAETGLLVGFFLPGDSLLFVAGALAAVPSNNLNIWQMIVVLSIAAILGDATGYLIGRKLGTKIYERPDSRLFKRAHLEKTQAFYEKHGPKTIVLARFVPIVRTFAPTVAGVAGMSYRTFALYNVFGGIGWIVSMSLAGYFLGNLPIVQKHFEKVVILIVILSIIPMIFHWVKERKHAKSPEEAVVSTIAPGLDAD